MRFAFIKAHVKTWPTALMCRVLRVARSGYYAWLKRQPSPRACRRASLAAKIRRVHEQSRRTYGSPRVHAALTAEGETACVNTVASIMKRQGIAAKTRRSFVPRTTTSDHEQATANVLQRAFTPGSADERWAADITYIATNEGWLYLAAVMDVGTRRIVGWSMADHLRSELVEDALMMALARRAPERGLLHHSDRGVQYASAKYQHLLREHGIQCSMSGKGNCWDNAAMESFWATLKTEWAHHHRYATRAAAKASLFEYIEVFYNRQRLHSSLGYMSPEAYELSLN